MHIAEGFLPFAHAAAWTAAAVPAIADGLRQLNRRVAEDRSQRYLLAAAAAFTFALSALKLPSVAGSSSHPTGVALGTILFGPRIMSVIGTLVLLFQALLLAHGGLTTLGANAFSMAIAGPWMAWAVYKLLARFGTAPSTFVAAFAADLFTYTMTATQLALAFPAADGGFAASVSRFLGVFGVTQLPLAIFEGLLTVFVLRSLQPQTKEALA
ncbi:MAG: energy-coupling factor ABC transporter permease [Bryobacteraceae bacterium]|nr:energy-coupling factor ABC transporter permease [Bryobacteraceae bacterium]